MTLYPINTGNFKLDGGAMFGVVPKTLWQRTNPADENNKVDLAMRSLLVEHGDRLTLIDTGLGDKQSERFFGFYDCWGDFDLDSSLHKVGFHREDITDVFMTHLHFDHCGGSVAWNNTRTGYRPAFKNARYWTNKRHWQWATKPNPREKASFLTENIIPLEESGQLCFVSSPKYSTELIATDLGFDVLFVDGHTDQQMIPHLSYKGRTVVFTADLLPTVGHIPLPYIPSYDTRPLMSMTEKSAFLDAAVAEEYYLFFQHDAHHEICTVKSTEKGVKLDNIYTFDELF